MGSRTDFPDVADVIYMTSEYYDPERDSGFVFSDPEVAIRWPEGLELTASQRDAKAPPLSVVSAILAFENVG